MERRYVVFDSGICAPARVRAPPRVRFAFFASSGSPKWLRRRMMQLSASLALGARPRQVRRAVKVTAQKKTKDSSDGNDKKAAAAAAGEPAIPKTKKEPENRGDVSRFDPTSRCVVEGGRRIRPCVTHAVTLPPLVRRKDAHRD